MKLSFFTKSFDGARAANKTLSIVVIAQMVLIIFLVVRLGMAKTQRELIPPFLTQSAKVGYGEADAPYYKAWGLYVAELVGNLTPGNTEFVSKALGRLFDAADYAKVHATVLAEGQQLQENSVVMFFRAQSVIYEPSTSRVFVTGEEREASPNGDATSVTMVTYQMTIHMDAGQPVIGDLSTYEGEAHTLAWVKAHPPAPQTAAAGQ